MAKITADKSSTTVADSGQLDTISTEDKEIMNALNVKNEAYYISLMQRYYENPTLLTMEEIKELRESNFLDKISEDIDKFKIKRVTDEEAEELKKVEVIIQDHFMQIGQLEFEKNMLLKSAYSLEEQKTDFLSKLAIKYRVPKNVSFVIDMETREIKVQQRNS